MYKFQNFKTIIFLYYFLKICKMDWLSEVQRVWICILLDKHLYLPNDFAKEYNVYVSMIIWLYEKYEKTNEVKDLSKSEQFCLIKEHEEH